MLEKVDGIILKTQDYGETHKLITIFSKRFGKITALARGAKKPKSRMAAVTQPFIYAQFFIYYSTGLSTIQQGEIIDSFRKIREDIVKTAYTAYVMELTDKLLDQNKQDAYLFDQLLQTVEWISENDAVDFPIMMYEMKLFTAGGFAPVVNKCVNCGRKGTAYTFSIPEGGLLCEHCNHVDVNSIHLPHIVTKLLYILAHLGLDRVGTISIKNENSTLLRQIMDTYYDQYGGYYLKTKKFLKQIDQLS